MKNENLIEQAVYEDVLRILDSVKTLEEAKKHVGLHLVHILNKEQKKVRYESFKPSKDLEESLDEYEKYLEEIKRCVTQAKEQAKKL